MIFVSPQCWVTSPEDEPFPKALHVSIAATQIVY